MRPSPKRGGFFLVYSAAVLSKKIMQKNQSLNPSSSQPRKWVQSKNIYHEKTFTYCKHAAFELAGLDC
jgi:hypothetical protein